jgi:Cu/Zn superoxide dismutase
VDGNGNTDGFAAAPVTHKVRLSVNLAPMPEGTVAIGNGAIQVNAWGLTPGSAHVVALLKDGQLTVLGSLTADGTGDVTGASFSAGSIPGGSRVVILDGDRTTSVIAQTKKAGGDGQYSLHAVEAGFPQGSLQGRASLVYDPAAQTITVTLSASGLTPGAHAAHIHVGSCASQGPVQYMVRDFTANDKGQIVNQARVITHVTTPLPGKGWYFNLHQGNMGDILANGRPTIYFRPLLCGDIASR